MAINAQSEETKPMSLRTFIWRAAMVLFTVSIVLCSGVLFWYSTERAQSVAELQAVIKKLQAQNAPLTGEELDAYYKIPAGEEDLTAEYVAALKAFDKMQLSPAELKLPVIGSGNTPPIGEEDDFADAAKVYLQRVQPQLQALQDLANRPGAVRYPIKLKDNFSALLMHAQQARTAARHLELLYRLHRREGVRPGCLSTIRAQIRLAETLRNEPTLISQLVRIAIFSIAVNCAQDFLGDQAATEEELLSLKEVLARVDFHRGMIVALNGERAFAYAAIQQKNMDALEPSDPIVQMSRFGTMAEIRPGDAANLLEFENELVEAANLPFPESLEKFADIGKRLKQQATDERKNLPWNRKLLANMILPAVETASVAHARGEALKIALRTAVAVEEFRLQQKNLPKQLDELVPNFLPTVPTDPFTGQPIRYVLGEVAYTIYSLGEDRVDGGGSIHAVQGKPADVGVQIEFGKAEKE